MYKKSSQQHFFWGLMLAWSGPFQSQFHNSDCGGTNESQASRAMMSRDRRSLKSCPGGQFSDFSRKEHSFPAIQPLLSTNIPERPKIDVSFFLIFFQQSEMFSLLRIFFASSKFNSFHQHIRLNTWAEVILWHIRRKKSQGFITNFFISSFFWPFLARFTIFMSQRQEGCFLTTSDYTLFWEPCSHIVAQIRQVGPRIFFTILRCNNLRIAPFVLRNNAWLRIWFQSDSSGRLQVCVTERVQISTHLQLLACKRAKTLQFLFFFFLDSIAPCLLCI